MIKKLLTGLLVGLPILLVGFSNAYVSPGNYTIGSVGSLLGSTYQVGVLAKGNVNTIYGDSSRYVFAPASNVLFFWDNYNAPRMILPRDGNCLTNGELQYYRVCDEIVDGVNFNESKCGSFVRVDKSYLSDFLNTINSNTDKFAYKFIQYNNDIPNTFVLCFSSHKEGKSLCFGVVNSVFNTWCFQPNFDNPYPSVSFTGTKYEYSYSSLPNDLIGKSPANPYISVNDSDYDIIDSTLTNYQVLVGCEKVGFDYNYCKGGYSSEVLFPDSGFPSLANYVRGQGVDILTMYNMYSGSYNTPNKFMQAISKGYNIHDYDWFRGKPLALYMFAVQYFPNKDDLQFSFLDIYNYCQLYEDVDNGLENNIYISDNLQVCKNQARIDKVNNYSDGYSIDGSGAMSIFGNGTGFSSPDEFFGKIYSFFNTNLIYDGESYPGVLPPVIYFFMIAIIFIRIISRSNG